MTDLELIQLVRDSLPEELSFEQIQTLRRRMPHSPALREALVEQLQFEQALCGVLGDVHVSLDWIFAQAASASAAGGVAKLFGWGSTTALVIAVASIGVLVQRPWAGGPNRAPVQVVKAAAVHELRLPRAEDLLPPIGVDKLEPPAPPAPEEPEIASPSDAAAPAPGPKPQPAPAAMATREQPVEPMRAFAPEQEAEQAGLFDELPGGAFEELAARLEALEGPHRPVLAGQDRQPGILLGGLAKLTSAWSPGVALRLRPAAGERLQLHLWKGVQGISLELYAKPQPGWAAYRITRRLNDPRPLTRALVATDGDRYFRTGRQTADVRLEEGRVVLARGDIPLLTVPFAGAPDAVVFEGAATLHDLALVPCKPLSRAATARPNALDASAADQLTWLRELPAGAQWTLLAEGRGELLVEDTAAPAWAAVEVADLGLREIVFELEDPLPGTGVYLGDASGRPALQLGFFNDETTGQTSFGWVRPGEMRTTARVTPGEGPAPLSDLRPWIRLSLAGGALRCATSADGIHWSEALEPLPVLQGGWSTAGLYALPGGGTRCLRVRRLEARRLAMLEALAAQSLRAQVSELDGATNFAGWQRAVRDSLPPGVDAEAWRRACAVELLAAASRPDLAPAVLLELLEGALSDETLSPADRLQLLSEAAMIYDASTPDAAASFVKQFERLGYALMQEAGARPYSAVRRALMTAPLWTMQPIEAMPPSLVRAELSQLAASGEAGPLNEFCRRLAFFAAADHAEIRELLTQLATLSAARRE